MNLKLLIKNHKSKMIILLFLLVIINIAYLVFKTKFDQKKSNYFNDYRLSIYIDKKDTLRNLESFLSLNELGVYFDTQAFLQVDRSQFELYINEIRKILIDKGFLFISVKKGHSLISSYKIDVEFQDRQPGRDLEVKQVMIDELKDIILNLENKIIIKEIDKINFDYRFKYLISSLSNDEKRVKEMEVYIKSQLMLDATSFEAFAMMQYYIMKNLENKKETFNQFVSMYNKLRQSTIYLIFKNQELKKNKVKQEISKINDLSRLNIINVNIGGLLLGLLLILFNEVRVNFYQNLIGKKKNS
jgi:hypothetical protein